MINLIVLQHNAKKDSKTNAKTTHVQPQKRKSSITNSWNTQQCPNGLINEDETIQENLEFHNNLQSPFSNNAQEDPELNDSSDIEVLLNHEKFEVLLYLQIYGIWAKERSCQKSSMKKINVGKGEELPKKFNEKNQCIDDGELEYFCGTIARNSDLTPLEYANWRKVPKDKKEMIWKVVQQNINEIQAENEANNVEFEDNAPIKGDILSQVLGSEKNGRVHGMGFGVSSRMLKKDNINVIQQLQEVNNENMQLKENFAILHVRRIINLKNSMLA
ncbi:hypothetical protein GH714_014836 [Hevea brasiliensis]|uniref:Uncharacterized protein n=1 Tax=Hevea brasiliensis TaxID=3981 RepID=A0A6A6MVR4_HEVBR|nr:hypothetical protein GH714_014836 [Hevea brasiliensis]